MDPFDLTMIIALALGMGITSFVLHLVFLGFKRGTTTPIMMFMAGTSFTLTAMIQIYLAGLSNAPVVLLWAATLFIFGLYWFMKMTRLLYIRPERHG